MVAGIPQDRPVYRVLNPSGFYGPDDSLYKEGEVIAFMGEPNLDFEPMNDMAKDRLKEYYLKLEKIGQADAAKRGTKYTGLPSLEDALAISREDVRRDVAVMNSKHKRDGIERIEPVGGDSNRGPVTVKTVR